MTTKPLRSLASGGLFLIIALWLAVFCFASGSTVQAVFEHESAACEASCRAYVAPKLRLIDGSFDELRNTIYREIVSLPAADESLSELDAALRNGLWQTALNRLAAIQGLLRLVCLRLEVFKYTFGLILLLAVATVIDALSLRAIAHHTFETSRPAVSFTSAIGFLGALIAGSALVLMPFAGAAVAGLTVIAVVCGASRLGEVFPSFVTMPFCKAAVCCRIHEPEATFLHCAKGADSHAVASRTSRINKQIT